MENLGDSLDPAAVAARSGGSDSLDSAAVAARSGRSNGLVAASSSGVGSGSSLDATSATTARRRMPGRWRRIPRPGAATKRRSQPHLEEDPMPRLRLIVAREGSREWVELMERQKKYLLKWAEELENRADDEPCFSEEAQACWRAYKAKFPGYLRWLTTGKVTFNPAPAPSDTPEEHLTAKYMEESLAGREICPQAQHFATLAFKHYNSKKTHKFEMATVLLSKCFSELDGATFAHVNFTATPQGQSDSLAAKRLFFAELMLVPELQADESAEPMRVLHVYTIDDSCYGGCHLRKRDIKKSLRNNMDYERCHACSDRIKHPKGDQFVAGHNSTRMPYYSAFPWIPK